MHYRKKTNNKYLKKKLGGRGVTGTKKGKRKRCHREQERKEEEVSEMTGKERGRGVKENKKGKKRGRDVKENKKGKRNRYQREQERKEVSERTGEGKHTVCVKYVLSVYVQCNLSPGSGYTCVYI